MVSSASLYKTDSVYLAVLLFFCAAIILIPFYTNGFATGPDMVQHFRFAIIYRDALSAGDFFPGWALDNLGFGNLGVRFYPPLMYYVAAAFYFLTGQWASAFLATIVGWLFVGCAGVYLFVRHWSAPSWALFAALLYACMPNHLYQIFQQFLYGEFAAAGIFPFCFLFLTKSLRSQKWTDAAFFSFSFALLILTHLPSTIICSVSLLIYGLCLIDRQRFAKQFLQSSISLLFSLALTSFYWIKVVTERQWLAHNDERFYTGYFSFAEYLFPLIIIPRVLYQSVVAAFLKDIMILLTAAVLIPAVIFLFVNRKDEKSYEHRTMLGLSVTAIAGFFMISRLSFYLWEYLPILQRIQFPFRWLGVLSFLTVAGGVLALSLLRDSFRNRARVIGYPVVVLLVLMMLFNVTQIVMPATTISSKEFDATITELSVTPSLSAWWTVWANEKAVRASDKVIAPNREVELKTWSPELREFTVYRGQPARVEISTFYYPYWKAAINGAPVEISKGENGLMELNVPPGEAHIRLSFIRPAAENAARFISLLSWLLFIMWSIFCLSKAKAARNLNVSWLRLRI